MSWITQTQELLKSGDWVPLCDLFKLAEPHINFTYAMRAVARQRRVADPTAVVGITQAKWIFMVGMLRKLDVEKEQGWKASSKIRWRNLGPCPQCGGPTYRKWRDKRSPARCFACRIKVVPAEAPAAPAEPAAVVEPAAEPPMPARPKPKKPKLTAFERRGSRSAVTSPQLITRPPPLVKAQAKQPPPKAPVAKPRQNGHSQNGHSQNGHSQNGHSQNGYVICISLKDIWQSSLSELPPRLRNNPKLVRALRKAFDAGCLHEHERLLLDGSSEFMLGYHPRYRMILQERARIWARSNVTPNQARRWLIDLCAAFCTGAEAVLSFGVAGLNETVNNELRWLTVRQRKHAAPPAPPVKESGLIRRTVGRFLSPRKKDQWRYKNW